MEEATASESPSIPNRRITKVSSFMEEASIPFSASEKPVLVSSAVCASKENGEDAEIVARALAPGEKCVVDSGSVCAFLGEDIHVREIQKGSESEGVDTGFKVLVADSEKHWEKLDAAREDFGRPLEIELIDDTAVVGHSNTEMELETGNVKKGSEAKREKNPRRRSKAAKKGSDESKNSSNLKVCAGSLSGFKRTDNGTKIVYSMKEMEALRYCNVKGQRKLWQEIYNALSPSVRTEYDELGCFRHKNKQSGLSLNTHPVPCVLGMAQARGGENCMNHYGGGRNCLVFFWEEEVVCISIGEEKVISICRLGRGCCLNFYGYVTLPLAKAHC